MLILDLVRGVAFGAFAVCTLVALGSWALRTRRIDPFSKYGHAIRRLTDPLLGPVERWLLKRGRNPQPAEWWLLGASIVGGILLVTVTEWVLVQAARWESAGASGPRGVLRLVVYYAGRLISIALIARVIGSWFGVGRFNRWMRPAYSLTDWIVGPLGKIVPRYGMIDITPLVAFFLIWIAVRVLIGTI